MKTKINKEQARVRVTSVLSTILVATVMVLIVSCGPSREEIELSRAQSSSKYKIGNVVYLKPDSCSALITGITVSFYRDGVTNFQSPYPVYIVRDCHGDDAYIKEEFIYGLKHQ